MIVQIYVKSSFVNDCVRIIKSMSIKLLIIFVLVLIIVVNVVLINIATNDW
jgi:hypothetical protein